jgi:hypothetical protein
VGSDPGGARHKERIGKIKRICAPAHCAWCERLRAQFVLRRYETTKLYPDVMDAVSKNFRIHEPYSYIAAAKLLQRRYIAIAMEPQHQATTSHRLQAAVPV